MDWWALPATCMGGTVDASQAVDFMLGTGAVEPIVSCGDVAWRFAGISMAGWNALISVALAGFSLLAAKRPKDARAPRS